MMYSIDKAKADNPCLYLRAEDENIKADPAQSPEELGEEVLCFT